MRGSKRDSIGGMRYAGASSSTATSLVDRAGCGSEFELTLEGICERSAKAEEPKISWNSVFP